MQALAMKLDQLRASTSTITTVVVPEESEQFEDSEPEDDVVAPVEDPISSSGDQCFQKRERRKRHFPKILGSEASGKRLLYIHIFFYIYCIYIQKNM
jgi:hypothetical protein